MRSYKDLAINTKLSLLVILAGGVAMLLSTNRICGERRGYDSFVHAHADRDLGRRVGIEQHGGIEISRSGHSDGAADLIAQAARRGFCLHLQCRRSSFC